MSHLTCYNIDMIKSFKHKGLEEFYKTGSLKGIQAQHKTKLTIILMSLDVMKDLTPFSAPSYRLHQLKGDLDGLWSVTVQANWRITFKYDKETNNVYIVDYQDYH